MTLYTSYADGKFACNDRIHSCHGLSLDEYIQLREDLLSGRFNAEELFEKARERRSGAIQ